MNEALIDKDVEVVESYMNDIHDDDEFHELYQQLCEQYDVDGPGQIPHKQ